MVNDDYANIKDVIFHMKVTNWILLCIQLLFMLYFIYTSIKYTRQFSSFKDFYTLLTLITLTISLMWDCVALPDAYPWQNIDVNDMLSFASMQLSKGFFLVSIVMYATRWVIIMMKNKQSTAYQYIKLKIAVSLYIIFSLSIEIYIIIDRSIRGANEDNWMAFQNEIVSVAVLEVFTYIIGSIACIIAYWKSYSYFNRAVQKIHNSGDQVTNNIETKSHNDSHEGSLLSSGEDFS